MAKYEVKLVPNDDPDAEGRWTVVELDRQPKCGDETGFEHIVKYGVYQPFASDTLTTTSAAQS